MNDTFKRLRSSLTLFVWVAAIVVAAVAGPFGTFYKMAPVERFAFWTIIITVALVLAYSFRFLTLIVLGYNKPQIVDACIVVLLTIFGAPTLWWIAQRVVQDETMFMFGFSSMFLFVGVISAAIYAARRLIPGLEDTASEEVFAYAPIDEAALPPAMRSQPRLLQRLRIEPATRILRLSAKDHLVEVVTDGGAEMLRMRLVDAIEKMEPVVGYCTHRSHWVAEDAIESVERVSAQKIFLVLSNGDRVPVSKKYRPHLEAAGIV
ncbi:LytTr DNA-binding domain protein [Roseovarius albus]|uniref:LytTr DNA-binding domain protein n=1 Tax=Roseovarius albus TaxID=1247867 RepID=A0A1X6YGD8_9RHOB|nr:LytTR family DNA-binding domain-containing protein [Roseovarius albus]SLN20046.1 LytTr DNA-binding domain protein [Roseovarius albus]